MNETPDSPSSKAPQAPARKSKKVDYVQVDVPALSRDYVRAVAMALGVSKDLAESILPEFTKQLSRGTRRITVLRGERILGRAIVESCRQKRLGTKDTGNP